MPVRRPNPRDADAADVGVLLEVANPGNRPFHTSNLEMTADWNVISLSCPMTPIRESGAGLAQTRSTQSAFCGEGVPQSRVRSPDGVHLRGRLPTAYAPVRFRTWWPSSSLPSRLICVPHRISLIANQIRST